MSRRILVVDDDRDFAESLADILELHGCAVTLAYSGDDALEHVHREQFDLTFLDIRMPGLGGVESLARIRAHRPQARVVMMTGYSLPEEIAEVRRHGAMGVLRKPLDLDAVLRMVEMLSRPRPVD